MTTTTSTAAFAGPVSAAQPFLAPAFAAPRSQQSLADYPPLTLFAAAELQQQRELQRQQQQQARSPAAAYQPALNLSINPKLPSLEGLLKQMQTGSPTASPVSAQQQRLSPVARDAAPMPALRTMISPTMAKRVLPVARAPLPGVAAFGQSPMYPQMSSSMGPSFPGRKRSWADASPMQQTMYPVKARTSPRPQQAGGTHRSRASKYCKIEGCQRVSQRNNLCHSHGGKRLCKEEGCSSKDRGNGFCIKHGGGKICSISGCEKKARRKGLCTQHFRLAEESSSNESLVSSPYVADHSAFRAV